MRYAKLTKEKDPAFQGNPDPQDPTAGAATPNETNMNMDAGSGGMGLPMLLKPGMPVGYYVGMIATGIFIAYVLKSAFKKYMK